MCHTNYLRFLILPVTSILGAKEKIIIKRAGKAILAQHMTYGWRTYSLGEIERMLQTAGAELENIQENYYTSPDNFGKRVLILAKKRSSNNARLLQCKN